MPKRITLVSGVLAFATVVSALQAADQSQLDTAAAQPIASPLVGARKGQLDTPEVVLSVKYEGGSIDGIYLAQYRKGMMVTTPPAPPEGNSLCLDLCHAGLGGDGCGTSCHDLIPVGLLQMTSLHTDNDTHQNQEEHSAETSEDHAEDSSPSQVDNDVIIAASSSAIGTPRTDVCPTLCANNLGYPLCGCQSELAVPSNFVPNWNSVCSAFCVADGYILRGCPSCDATTQPPFFQQIQSRALNTMAGWKAWCNVQCLQGQGGAACNCDRAPFSM